VWIKLGQFVKEVLWKRVKFITDEDVLLKAMNVCAKHVGVEEKEKPEWRLRHGKKVQFSIKGRRNNCAQDMEKAYKRKYDTGCSRIVCSEGFDIANHICWQGCLCGTQVEPNPNPSTLCG
jgi:hypothetical protein